MHYTSIENIHKVIDPLFFSELEDEWQTLKAQKPKTKKALQDWRKKCEAFQDKLANLTFFDKRQAYWIQANGKRKSPKALDIRGSGYCLLLGSSIWNSHFRGKRPTTAHQVLPTGANGKEIV